MRTPRMTALLPWCCILCACGSSGARPTAPVADSAVFDITGDAESAAGARWTYRGRTGGITYDLQGFILKPRGTGTFPAVIISHGAGGNADGYSRAIATEMVRWGVVAIATNYTHAGNVALGAPGLGTEVGASTANVLRARKVYDLLTALTYVDRTRIAAHGHSMGGYVTEAFAGAHPSLLRVASVTGAGVRGGPADIGAAAAAPAEAQVTGIRTPFQLQHGEIDTTVPLSQAQRFRDILARIGVAHELHVYPGAGHNDVSRSADVLAKVKAWYETHGMF